jgi:hypothetical protein
MKSGRLSRARNTLVGQILSVHERQECSSWIRIGQHHRGTQFLTAFEHNTADATTVDDDRRHR